MTSLIPILAITMVALGYAALCWLRPFRPCRKCHGHGWTRGKVLRRSKPCRVCRGEGFRIRAGRRLYNDLRRLHRDAEGHENTIRRLTKDHR